MQQIQNGNGIYKDEIIPSLIRNNQNFRILPFFARGGTFVQHPCCKTAIYENLGNFGI